MKPLLAVVAVLSLAGCGGGRCRPAEGAYRVRMTARSGTCAQTAETVVVLPAATDPATGCVGISTTSEDGCEGTVDVTCPDGQGGTIRTTGSIDWSADNSGGTGATAIVARNSSGAVVCQGSYDVTYTRL